MKEILYLFLFSNAYYFAALKVFVDNAGNDCTEVSSLSPLAIISKKYEKLIALKLIKTDGPVLDIDSNSAVSEPTTTVDIVGLASRPGVTNQLLKALQPRHYKSVISRTSAYTSNDYILMGAFNTMSILLMAIKTVNPFLSLLLQQQNE